MVCSLVTTDSHMFVGGLLGYTKSILDSNQGIEGALTLLELLVFFTNLGMVTYLHLFDTRNVESFILPRWISHFLLAIDIYTSIALVFEFPNAR